MSESIETQEGGCDCRAVRYSVSGELKDVTVCHCGQCRRIGGYAWASVRVAPANLTFLSDDDLVWRQSSDWAERGFCAKCGSALFYRMHDKPDRIAVAAGSFDDTSGLKVWRHIFVKDKAGYMDIGGEAPQIDRF